MTTRFDISGSRPGFPQRTAPLAARPAAVRARAIRLGHAAACGLSILATAGSRFPLHMILRAETTQVLAVCLMQIGILSQS